jgi:hypothetical protein
MAINSVFFNAEAWSMVQGARNRKNGELVQIKICCKTY